MRDAHELFFRDHENACISFEVDSFCFLDNFEAFDGNVLLIAETESYEVEHVLRPGISIGTRTEQSTVKVESKNADWRSRIVCRHKKDEIAWSSRLIFWFFDFRRPYTSHTSASQNCGLTFHSMKPTVTTESSRSLSFSSLNHHHYHHLHLHCFSFSLAL